MKISFLCKTESYGSTLLRGVQVASEINLQIPELAEVRLGGLAINPSGLKQSVLVPILSVGDGLESYFTLKEMESQKKFQNLIYADILDSFVWPNHNPFLNKEIAAYFQLLDGVIVYNKESEDLLRSYFPHLRISIIPHQWNSFFLNLDSYERRLNAIGKKCLYAGTKDGFQLVNEDFTNESDFIFDNREFLKQLKYKYHLSYRAPDSLHYLFKPATKLATASAVHSLLFSSADRSMVHILGAEWPLYFGNYSEFKEKYYELERDVELQATLFDYFRRVVRPVLSPPSIAAKYIQLCKNSGVKCAA
jgi:hypothetical protein